MPKTYEAVIDSQGNVRLFNDVQIEGTRRALVTILDEPARVVSETALLSEAVLGRDWNRPEEDEAWDYLQSEK